MTYYVDVEEADNIECALDGIVELVSADSNATCVSVTAGGVTTFSIVAGVSRISATNLGGDAFDDGDKIIIRGSVSSGATGLIDNDGCYTIIDANIDATTISVEEGVTAAVSVSAVVTFDEFATFVLHPTKPTGQMLVFIWSDSLLAEYDVSFEPGGYWAAKSEPICPVFQGEVDTGDADKMHLVQIETAPYLQTEEEDLATSAIADVDKKGTLLMRIFPGVAGDALLVGEIEVAYIMIA